MAIAVNRRRAEILIIGRELNNIDTSNQTAGKPGKAYGTFNGVDNIPVKFAVLSSTPKWSLAVISK